MKILLIFMFLLINQNMVSAKDQTELKPAKAQIWRIGDNYYPFTNETENRVLISENCLELKNECMALKAYKSHLKINFTKEQLFGGKNPSSLLCSIGHKGKVLILKDKNGNENSFCQFIDYTMISANDL